MMPIIRVKNLSKKYYIGGQQKPYSTLRDSLVEVARAPLKAFRRSGSDGKNSFWALHDVSFDVMPGEVVGIIGRNGAGKSTLLKILSRITEPTTGRVEIYGRVSSLLEVGTGFHHELTGRENIYLNGAILGMKRADINRKFDEMVDFAEVEKFIDTPVKYYSSGMHVRLAFAVAAHLEPEILIIDEVLAVGDAAFQKKCLSKMGSAAAGGRTVLFVSHNMPVVRQLCSRGVLIHQGRVAKIGAIGEVIQGYTQDMTVEGAEVCFDADPNDRASILKIRILDKNGNPATRIPHTEQFTTEVEYVVNEPLLVDRLWWVISRSDGTDISISGEEDALNYSDEVREPGHYLARVTFPEGILNEDRYQCRVTMASKTGGWNYKFGPYFEIFDDTDYGALNAGGKRESILLNRLDWSNHKVD